MAYLERQSKNPELSYTLGQRFDQIMSRVLNYHPSPSLVQVWERSLVDRQKDLFQPRGKGELQIFRDRRFRRSLTGINPRADGRR